MANTQLDPNQSVQETKTVSGRKLRVGIIGLGGISRWAHMPFYAASPDIEVAAICDKVPSKIENFKKEFSLPETVAVFENYKDLLEVKDLDFIDICTKKCTISLLTFLYTLKVDSYLISLLFILF